MAAAAAEAAHQTAHGGALRLLVVGKGHGDIHLRHAVTDGDADALAAAQQAADEVARRIAVVGTDAGELDAAPHRQVPDHRVLRHAEQAQLLPPAQRSDVQAGHGVSPAVKGAGIGPLAAAAARADHRPLAIAQIHVRRQHGAESAALRLVVHRIGQPRQLLRRADLVGIGLRSAAVGPAGGDAVPAVFRPGGLQQLLQLAGGGGVRLLDGGKALLPGLLDGGIVGKAVQLHRSGLPDGCHAPLQRLGQQLPPCLVETADVVQLRRQRRDALLRQIIQSLPRLIACLLQGCGCRRVHIRRSIALREACGQVRQRLAGVGVDGVHLLHGGGAVQLGPPALIGGQRRGHIVLRIVPVVDVGIVEVLLPLGLIGGDSGQQAVVAQIFQSDIADVRDGSGTGDLRLRRRQQGIRLRLLRRRVHAASGVSAQVLQQLLAAGIRAGEDGVQLLLTLPQQRLRLAAVCGGLDALQIGQDHAVIEDALVPAVGGVALIAGLGPDELRQQRHRSADLVPAVTAGDVIGRCHRGHPRRVVAGGDRHVHHAPQRVAGGALHMAENAAVPLTHDAAHALRRGAAVVRHRAGVVGAGQGAGAGEARIIGGVDVSHDPACAVAQSGGAIGGDIGVASHVPDGHVQHVSGDVVRPADPAHDAAHAALAVHSALILAQAHLGVVRQQAHDAAHAAAAGDGAVVGAVADDGSLLGHARDTADVVDVPAAAHGAVAAAAVHHGLRRRLAHDAPGHRAVTGAVVGDVHRGEALKDNAHTVSGDAARTHAGDLVALSGGDGDGARRTQALHRAGHADDAEQSGVGGALRPQAVDDAVAAVKRPLIALAAGAADGRPDIAVQVDVRGQTGTQRPLAAVDLVCEPRQLRGSGNAIGVLRRAVALRRPGTGRAVPLVPLRHAIIRHGGIHALRRLLGGGREGILQRLSVRRGMAVFQRCQRRGQLPDQRLAGCVQLFPPLCRALQPHAAAGLGKGGCLVLDLL